MSFEGAVGGLRLVLRTTGEQAVVAGADKVASRFDNVRLKIASVAESVEKVRSQTMLISTGFAMFAGQPLGRALLDEEYKGPETSAGASISGLSKGASVFGGAIVGSKGGAALGTLIAPGIGTAIGQVVGGLVGAILPELATKWFDEAGDYLAYVFANQRKSSALELEKAINLGRKVDEKFLTSEIKKQIEENEKDKKALDKLIKSFDETITGVRELEKYVKEETNRRVGLDPNSNIITNTLKSLVSSLTDPSSYFGLDERQLIKNVSDQVRTESYDTKLRAAQEVEMNLIKERLVKLGMNVGQANKRIDRLPKFEDIVKKDDTIYPVAPLTRSSNFAFDEEGRARPLPPGQRPRQNRELYESSRVTEDVMRKLDREYKRNYGW